MKRNPDQQLPLQLTDPAPDTAPMSPADPAPRPVTFRTTIVNYSRPMPAGFRLEIPGRTTRVR
jgi:hypothetical protein